MRVRRKRQHLRRCTYGFYSFVNFSNLLLSHITVISMCPYGFYSCVNFSNLLLLDITMISMLCFSCLFQPEAGKKRAAENALKTLLSDKKVKVATPSAQKTGVYSSSLC